MLFGWFFFLVKKNVDGSLFNVWKSEKKTQKNAMVSDTRIVNNILRTQKMWRFQDLSPPKHRENFRKSPSVWVTCRARALSSHPKVSQQARWRRYITTPPCAFFQRTGKTHMCFKKKTRFLWTCVFCRVFWCWCLIF